MKLPQLLFISFAVVSFAQTSLASGQNADLAVVASSPKTVALQSTVNAFFASDSAKLSAAAKSALEPLIHRYRYSAEHRYQLTGYSDVRGSRDHNMRLSMRRAEAVRSYLIENGVRPERITVEAHGESRAAVNVLDSQSLIYDRKVLVAVKQTAASMARIAHLGH